MRIHHLNCGTMCPFGGRIMDGIPHHFRRGHLVCHCLLAETDNGLVLIDTGFGLRDIYQTRRRINGFFRAALQMKLHEDETAIRQVQTLGFRPEDVRHIVLTHLDFDHAGGLDDFPNAAVHLLTSEVENAVRRKGFISKRRFRPSQWSTHLNWRTYQAGGEPWFGFDCVRNLEGLSDDILLVPLVGHTFGHAGVAVKSDSGWLLHAGDAYFYRGEMNERYSCPIGLRAYQRMMEVDRRARLMNQNRLRSLVATHSKDVTVFSAHDVVEYQMLSQRPAQTWLRASGAL